MLEVLHATRKSSNIQQRFFTAWEIYHVAKGDHYEFVINANANMHQIPFSSFPILARSLEEA